MSSDNRDDITQGTSEDGWYYDYYKIGRSTSKTFLTSMYQHAMMEKFMKQFRRELHKRRMWEAKMRKKRSKRRSR